MPVLAYEKVPSAELGLELNTKSKLLIAAIRVFANKGFEATSVREIGEVAGVSHCSIKYHFSTKNDLWHAAVSHLYGLMDEEVHGNADKWKAMTIRESTIDATRCYVRFNARHPELEQMIAHETAREGARCDWLNDTFILPFTDRAVQAIEKAQELGVYSNKIPPMNLFYMIRAATRSVFGASSTIERNFGINVFSEAEIERHTDALIELFISPDRTNAA